VVRTAPLSVTLPEFFDPVSGRALGDRAASLMPSASRPFPAGEPPPTGQPTGSHPRALIPPPFQNTTGHRRRWRGIDLTPFAQLRALSRFDLVRVVIRDIKGQCQGIELEVAVRDEFKDQARALQPKVDAARAFVECPDPLADLDLAGWVGKAIEEILVTDALSLYPIFSKGGEPLGLGQIDGATIKPLVDDLGRPPLPPNLAYLQYVHGLPETGFYQPLGTPSSRELWYLPYERQPDSPYGYSSTEQVLMTVNLAIRHTLHDLAYYTSGSLPDSLYTMPEGWNQETIEKFQLWWDDVLDGRSDRRAGGVRFVPQGTYTATKTREFKYDFLEWLGRVIAWGFGVSPLPIMRISNRAQADRMEQSVSESGVRPLIGFVVRILNRYVQRVLGLAEIEVRLRDDEVEDPAVVATRNVSYVHGGIRTLNATRADLGEEPYPAEFGDRPFVMTPSGPLFLDTIEEERKRREEQAAALAARLGGGGQPGGGAPGAGPVTDPEPDPDTLTEEPALERLHRCHVEHRGRVRDDLQKRHRVQKRHPGRAFVSTLIPPRGAARRFQKAELALTTEQKALEASLRTAVSAWLAAQLPVVTAWAIGFLPPAPAAKLAKQLPLPPFVGEKDLFNAISAVLFEAHQVGAGDAALSIAADLSTPSETALAYAQERAAELVGKTWIAGQLVDNPSPKFAITDTLRQDVQSLVTRAIAEGMSPQDLTSKMVETFGPWRAETIARTETGIAYNAGAADVYEASDVAHVEILDGEGCLPSGHLAGAPKASGSVGVVEENAEADGQVWTVAQWRELMLGHPNCVRAGVPYFAGEV
jgi:hypothetical protein